MRVTSQFMAGSALRAEITATKTSSPCTWIDETKWACSNDTL
jgi:hypothetical protein